LVADRDRPDWDRPDWDGPDWDRPDGASLRAGAALPAVAFLAADRAVEPDAALAAVRATPVGLSLPEPAADFPAAFAAEPARAGFAVPAAATGGASAAAAFFAGGFARTGVVRAAGFAGAAAAAGVVFFAMLCHTAFDGVVPASLADRGRRRRPGTRPPARRTARPRPARTPSVSTMPLSSRHPRPRSVITKITSERTGYVPGGVPTT